MWYVCVFGLLGASLRVVAAGAGRAVKELLVWDWSSSKKKLEAGRSKSRVGAEACEAPEAVEADFGNATSARAAVLARSACRSSMARLYDSAKVSGFDAMDLSTSRSTESVCRCDPDLIGISSTLVDGAGKSER